MRPTFVRLFGKGGLPGWLVLDYQFLLTTAIILGCLLTLFLCRRRGLPPRISQDLLFWGIPSLLLGSKILYYLQFGWANHTWLEFLSHGFSLYGGLFGLLTSWLLYYRIRPFPLGKFLDCATPGLALGLVLGRTGCFMAGCDGGRLCSLAWCIRFPPNSDAFVFQASREMIAPGAKFSLPAHPTQLYEVVFALAVLIVTWLWLKRDPRPGSVFLAGVMGYALYRFLSEPIRVDLGGIHPFGLTFASFLSLAILASGAVIWGWYFQPLKQEGRGS